MSSLSNRIIVKGEYTRAVNIKRDSHISEYILTDNAVSMLREIARNMTLKTAPCAWHLIGPYGAGKSAFALYLSALLGARDVAAGKKAIAICAARDKELAKQFQKLGKKKLCPVLVTGSHELLAPRLLDQLKVALKQYFPGKPPVGISDLYKRQPNLTSSTLINILRQANQVIIESGGAGIFIAIDEMGKFLEHDAINPESDNAYLLQELGELTLKRSTDKGRILLLGIMHHSADYYLRRQGKEAINEWRKVEGRFEQLAFIENSEHMLRLLSRMFECPLDSHERKKITATIDDSTKAFLEAGLFANQTFNQSVREFFVACYPLHPATAVLLATLSEKIGQNERTIFSYISSAQQHGFMDAAMQLKSVKDFIPPWSLYDYFLSGGLPMVTDFSLRRIWAEIETAMNRLGADAPVMEVQMLKTIALFNLAGIRGNFTASLKLLGTVFGNITATKRTLKSLTKKSLIVYRKFGDDYRIWQGSDFDLDPAIEKERQILGEICLPDTLNESQAMPPIIAHRHAIKTGNLRRLIPYFVDAQTWNMTPAESAAPRLIIFLSKIKTDTAVFNKVCARFQSDLVVRGSGGTKLENIVRENRAIQSVLHSNRELLVDPVALREAKNRAMQIARSEERLTKSIIEAGEKFYWRDQYHEIHSHRDMQELVSAVMDELYHAAPRVANELINRNKPSAQAVAARNKLLLALQANADQEDLGIEKYPPEKAMYLSMLKKAKLHRYGKDGWALHSPKNNDPCNYQPVWDCMQTLFSENPNTPQCLTVLSDVLQAAPFGLKTGVLPIFYAIFILSDKNIQVYEDGKYIPFFSSAHLERFVVRPETFKFQRIVMTKKQESMLESYRTIRDNRSKLKQKSDDILSVTRPLITLVNNLPEYTRNTNKSSNKARDFCNAITRADSPYDMLLHDIPRALGFDSSIMSTQSEQKQFNIAIGQVITELNGKFTELLSYFREILANTLILEHPSLDELRRSLAGRVDGLERYSIDKMGLLAFFRQAMDKTGDGEAWLRKLLLFLSDKNPEKWEDSDSDRAEYKLAEYLRRMTDLENLRMWEQKEKVHEDMKLVRIVSTQGESEYCVRMENSAMIKTKRQKIEEIIKDLPLAVRSALLTSMLESELCEMERNDVTKKAKNI